LSRNFPIAHHPVGDLGMSDALAVKHDPSAAAALAATALAAIP
jgi:hypothetical protein